MPQPSECPCVPSVSGPASSLVHVSDVTSPLTASASPASASLQRRHGYGCSRSLKREVTRVDIPNRSA